MFPSPPPVCHRPDSPRFGPDGTLVINAFRADANDVDKLLVFPSFPEMDQAYFISTQVANQTDGGPREFAQDTGRLKQAIVCSKGLNSFE